MAYQNISLDCSDIDQYLGIPMNDVSSLREPVGRNDIRRWVHAMHYPNRLHYDPDFAAESRWGDLIAPQSFAVATDDGHGAAPACVGCIPNSHLLFGGDEWWFHGPRIKPGDEIYEEKIPVDYTVKETKFAGPTCFQRGDNIYYNAGGEKVATQRCTSIRYSAEAGAQNVDKTQLQESLWNTEEMGKLEKRRFEWIKMLHDLGHGQRWWNDVNVGDALPERVFGPHSIASFTTEWRAFLVNTWGTTNLRKQDLAGVGFTEEMAGLENDPDMQLIEPQMTDGAYIGPSRGHLFPEMARTIGMPRSYGYGATMGAWTTDYLAGWAGEWGLVVHTVANFRSPALSGDITIQSGEVIDKLVDDKGRHLVQVRHSMKDQNGKTMATGTAEIELLDRGSFE